LVKGSQNSRETVNKRPFIRKAFKEKFSPLVTVKSPQEIEEKKRNKFFGVFLSVQIPYIPA
jgi:hypothetical protein